MTTTATHETPLITADELLEGAYLGRCELIDGRIVQMSPAGMEHGRITSRAAQLIGPYVIEHHLGLSYGAETGFILRQNPDRVRAPDFAVLRADRVPAKGFTGFFIGAPDFLIEVNSPFDRASEVLAKVDEWLAAGATSCWVIDPPTRSVAVYRNGGSITRYRDSDEINDEPTLPGLVLKVAELFD